MAHLRSYHPILSPGAIIRKEIASFKNEVKHLIGDFESYTSIGHVTLVDVDLEKEDVLARRCERLYRQLKNIPCIELSINKFDSFKNGDKYVIYAKIEYNEEVGRWFKAVGLSLGRRSRITPHITIAKNLTEEQFTVLWSHFDKKEYRRKMFVDAITLLMKKGHKRYDMNIPLGKQIDLIEKEPMLFD
jgi:2'-5' RNA ligase